jgi:hypothetical protein
VTEGTWQYRISYGTQGEWSLPTASNAVAIDIVPPTGLTVHQIDGGVQLDWASRTTGAGQQFIERFDPGQPKFSGTPVASLPVTAHTYVDLLAAPWPAATYSVGVSNGSFAASSPEVPIGSVRVTGPLTLTGTALTLPATTQLVRTNLGLVHGVDYQPNTTTLYRDTGTGWEAHPTSSAVFTFGGLFSDAAGHPHTVYSDGYLSQATTEVAHEWHDGSAWRTETVTSIPDLLQAAVTADGVVHALARRRESSGSYTSVYVAGSGGSFASRDLVPSVLPPLPPMSSWGCLDPTMDVAAEGTAWVLFTCGSGPGGTTFVLFRRSAAGVWTEELLPFGGGGVAATAIAGSGQSAAVIDRSFNASGMDWVVHLRSATGWGNAEILPSNFRAMDWRGAVMSPDGKRVVAQFSDYPNGIRLAIRTPTGWESVLLGSPSMGTDRVIRMGHTATGALVITAPDGQAAAGRPNASIYLESP